MIWRNVTFKVYTTNHPINYEVSRSLALGFDAQRVPAVRLLDEGVPIVYGILRGTGAILKDAEALKRDYVYCDHAYFGPCRIDRSGGYYRLVKNGRYASVGTNYRSDRFERLNLEVKPWRKKGDHIVVVPMSGYVAQFEHINATDWLERVLETLGRTTKRDIVIKPKDNDLPFEDVLEGAHAVVARDSMAAVDAARLGVPVFVHRRSAAAPVGNFEGYDIENPVMPEREQWLANLAYQQFTIKEIESGLARKILWS